MLEDVDTKKDELNKELRVVYKTLDENIPHGQKLLLSESDIIDEVFASTMQHYFPGYLYGLPWYLYYSKSAHGSSYNTLLRNCKNGGECLLI